jgi:hypothetical protein
MAQYELLGYSKMAKEWSLILYTPMPSLTFGIH